MARTVLPIVGAAAGAYFGSPQLGFLAGSVAGGLVDPIVNRGPKIGETGAQTSAEGAPRAIIYGTASCTGNVIATGPLIETISVESQGKGGPVSETSVAYRNYAIRICEGPIAGVLRVWQDDKLVYDVRPGSLMLAESALWLQSSTQGKVFYLGTEDQLPDIFLQLNVSGVGETPAYRGTAYMVVGLEDLTDRRGSIPQYRFEVASTTDVTEILGPLVINDWEGARPIHSDSGDMKFTTEGLVDYNDFTTAANAAAAAGGAAAVDSKVFVAYSSSLNLKPNVFTSGATLVGDPETVTYRLAAREPDFWDSTDSIGAFVCDVMALNGVNPGDDTLCGIYSSGLDDKLVLAKLYNHPVPTSGIYSEFYNNCTNYPPIGANFPQAAGNPVLRLIAKRVPSAPEGYTKVIGTAHILCDVEYRAGALYQNALGPVLLPGDPDYNNATFWSDAREAAILAGTMHADVPHSPSTVSAYATGISTLSGAPVPLGAIVSDIHDRCGIPIDKFDVSELPDLVDGLVLAGDYTGRDAVDTLRGPYFFDKAEYDRKLHYPKRGKPVVLTLTDDDLVEEPDTTRREQAVEFPKKLHLFYQHAASGYAAVKATSSRSSPDARVVGELSVQVPVVLDEDEAAQIADKLHKVAWAEAEGEVILSVPESFIGLVPSDCIGLSLRGQVKRLRIDQMDYADGLIALTLRHDRQGAYTSNATGVPIPAPTLPPSTIVGDTVLAVMDLPARIESEDDLNYLVAGTGTSPGWYGWTLQRSLDAGANYQTADTFTRAAVMGSLVNSIPSSAAGIPDRTNRVRVQLYRAGHAIESITELQFLTEGGAFALEKPDGSYEVMQYLDAEEDSNGIFELSTLHRGRLNSGASAHTAGAKFVLLSDAAHIATQFAWIGQAITHRAPSLGQSPELADPQTATFVGRSQIEWPVAYLTLARTGSVISAVWYPRHRFGTDVAPVASRNLRGYRVTLDDGVLPAVTFDTDPFDPSATSFSYAASALGSPLTVSVSALNRITGAGPATSGTV